MPSIHRFVFAILIASLGVAATAGRVPAEEAKGPGQPANQIGLVHDHDPVKYAGYVLYFVEGKLMGHDMLTQTWSIVPREEAEFEHAFKIETHAIHSDTDDAKPSFNMRNRWKGANEDSVRYELFHQDKDRGLVLDAIQGPDGKPQEIDHETEHYIFPGSLEVGTKWLSEPVTSSLPGTCQLEVIGSEIYNGTNCWVVSSTRQPKKDPLMKNSETMRKTARFLFDPLTLSVLRIDAVTEGVGPLGRAFKFVYHMEVAE
ncbi:MAG: hypothetical protein ISQ70_09085 [Pirellulales bacterium]|nr:hypothetical protein [Pirellulales bacterium]MBL7193524.1 hypothetical protein [Pirellulales bacterium]